MTHLGNSPLTTTNFLKTSSISPPVEEGLQTAVREGDVQRIYTFKSFPSAKFQVPVSVGLASAAFDIFFK